MPDELRDSEPGELLRAALSGGPGARDDAVTQGEKGALAAFRAARDAGLHASLPTRDLDDWTPVDERRRSRRSLKAVVAALVASVTLGGVAVATGGLPENFLGTPAPPPGERPTRSVPAPASEPTKTGATGGGTGDASRSAPPGTAAPLPPEEDPSESPAFPGKSRDALCRAFVNGEGKTEGKAEGKTSKSPAWERLVAAAGGEELVPAYCGHSVPARGLAAEPRPGEEENGRSGSTGTTGKGAERSRADRP
ncbi:hypothetical protein ACFZCG_40640 [Streptomyces tanashiensis]|uniref:hypothetical protein n=1 Tax=Streptomyces tanashiensis TaxID=67367 RepID=UPI0036E35E08